MLPRFWRKSGAKEVPEKVLRSMASQFRLDPPQVDRMRYVDKKGKYATRPVRYVRIFDPTLIPTNLDQGIRTYDGVEAYRKEAVLFEGHIEKDGTVLLVDRRPPKQFLKKATTSSER